MQEKHFGWLYMQEKFEDRNSNVCSWSTV